MKAHDCWNCLVNYFKEPALPDPESLSPDPVNHPAHYLSPTGLESIEIIEAFNLDFALGNVIKYVLRSSKKGTPLTDLKKAQWYLARAISNL